MMTLLMLAAASPALAQTPAVLDAHLLPPQLREAGRATYLDHFVNGNLPRAFAIAGNGAFGGRWGDKTLEGAIEKALASCQQKGGTDCAVYAQNLDVVWHGRAPEPRTAVPGPLLSAAHFVIVPDERYFWHGPQTASGLYVWGHGKGAKDERGEQPHPYVRLFNNAGFDIVRFDREQVWDDKTRAEEWLRAAIPQLRAMGYRKLIIGGQSRGAWNAVQTLDVADLADVVIAVSPAAHGTDATSVSLRQGPELWTILHDAPPSPHTRVAIVQFRNDPYAEDEDDRRDKFRDMLFPKVAAGLLIDRPSGFEGHSAAFQSAFAEQFGACLLHFAFDPKPASGC
jgi:hypothetical protein